MSRRVGRRVMRACPAVASAIVRGQSLAATWAHWLRADSVQTSGANLASLTNLGTAGGVFSVSAGTIVAPSSDAALRGKPSFSLSGSQWLDSSLPASSWRFPHDGTGFWCQVVYVPLFSGTQVVLGTRGTGSGAHVYQTSASYGMSIVNGGSLLYNVNGGTAGTVGVGGCLGASYVSGNSVKVITYDRGVQVASSSAAGVPDSGNPPATMRIGATTDGTLALSGRIAEVFIHTSIPSASDQAIWLAYLRARYGF